MPRAKDAKRMSEQEYLEFEKSTQEKHEFSDGFVFAMAGASENHNLICTNILTQVRLAARGTACRAFMSDMKFKSPEGNYYYPDIFLSCDEDEQGTSIKTKACFIVEVLSDSTSDIDRGEKLRNYRKTQTLQAYILVSQPQQLVEVYKKLEDGTWRHEILEEGKLELPCVDLALSFDAIYEDVAIVQNT